MTQFTGSNDTDYFATAPYEEITQELQAKVDDYYNYIVSSSLVDLWRRSYRAYYGMRQNFSSNWGGVFDVGSLTGAGDQGEIIRCKVNHFANLVTHQLVMTTSSRTALKAKAINSDAKSLISAKLGDGLLDYYFREGKFDRNRFLCIETGIVLGEGYVVLDWDAKSGKRFSTDPDGKPLYAGKPTAENFTPFQVIKDVSKNSDADQKWYITHGKMNRYDLMAAYPDLALKIKNVNSDDSSANGLSNVDPSKIITAVNYGQQNSDDIPYMKFYHDRTEAMPTGRFTIFIDGSMEPLYDGPLPYRSLPIYRLAPRNIIGTPFGWTNAFDILALQELLDKLYTVVSSNVLGSGVANFWSPPNNGITVSQLGGNRSLIESMVKPEVLELLKTPAEVYNYIAKVEAVMSTLMGISAVNRGELPSADMSGSAMAFMASQAITFTSGLQESATQLSEGMGTGIIDLLKDFADVEQLVSISGKMNRPQMKYFKGSDLEPIESVVCETVGALSKTTAGRLSLADNLLAANKLKDGHEYITLVETGQMDPMTNGPLMENFLIEEENEWLLEGKVAKAIRTDTHQMHINKHKEVLSSQTARRNGALVVNVLNHIKEHEDLMQMMQMTDPAFLAATGQQPLPFPVAPQQPQQEPQQGANPAEILAPVNGFQQEAAQVRQPNLPNLPKGSDQQTQQSYAQIQQQGR